MALEPHHKTERPTELGSEWQLKELSRERFLESLVRKREWKEAMGQQWERFIREREEEWKRERERELEKREWEQKGEELEWERERELEERKWEREQEIQKWKLLLEPEQEQWKLEWAEWLTHRERERERVRHRERERERVRYRERERDRKRERKWKREQERKQEWERQLEDLRSRPLDQEGDSTVPPHGYSSKYTVFMPRAFDIVWGNDARYWCLPERYDEAPAELVKVSWFEVSSKLHNIESGKKYEISFRVSLRRDAFGWRDCPIYLMAKIGKKGKYISKKIQLDEIQSIPTKYLQDILIDVPKTLYNGHEIDQIYQIQSFPAKIPQEKFEIEVTTPVDDDDDKILYFGLYEVWSGIAKGGLLIHNAIVKTVN